MNLMELLCNAIWESEIYGILTLSLDHQSRSQEIGDRDDGVVVFAVIFVAAAADVADVVVIVIVVDVVVVVSAVVLLQGC